MMLQVWHDTPFLSSQTVFVMKVSFLSITDVDYDLRSKASGVLDECETFFCCKKGLCISKC